MVETEKIAVDLWEEEIPECPEEETFPVFGPQTTSEAHNRLVLAEQQFESGYYTIGKEFFSQTRRKIKSYAT